MALTEAFTDVYDKNNFLKIKNPKWYEKLLLNLSVPFLFFKVMYMMMPSIEENTLTVNKKNITGKIRCGSSDVMKL